MFGAFSRALPQVRIEPDYVGARPTADATANARHIAKFQSRDNPTSVDPLTLTVPHGQLLVPKLVGNLASEEVTLRLASSNQLYVLFNQKEEYVVDCINCGGVVALLRALEDPVPTVRANSASALRTLCGVWAGREELIKQDGLESLLAALGDDHTGVVYHALQALVNLDSPVDEHRATAKLIELGAIHTFLEVIERTGYEASDASAVVVPALNAIANCCSVKEGFVRVLDAKAPQVILAVLRGPVVADHAVAAAAGKCISGLAIFATARRVLAAERVAEALVVRVSALLPLLFEPEDPEQSFEAIVVATLALTTAMYATSVEPQIRRDLVAAGVIPLMHSVLKAGATPMRIVLLRLAVMLSEDATGRKDCAMLRPQLTLLERDGEQGSAETTLARRALQHLDGKRSMIM